MKWTDEDTRAVRDLLPTCPDANLFDACARMLSAIDERDAEIARLKEWLTYMHDSPECEVEGEYWLACEEALNGDPAPTAPKEAT